MFALSALSRCSVARMTDALDTAGRFGSASSSRSENLHARSEDLHARSEDLHARSEIASALRLLSVRGIGPARLAKLVECFGSAFAAENADSTLFSQASGLSIRDAVEAQAQARRIDLTSVFQSITAHRASIEMRCILGRPTCGFPDLLLACPDPPWLLLVKGALSAAPEPAVAIVGSRRATSYGRLHAGRLASALAERGVTVVSGGARGIDAEAHRAALRARGRTIAVVASGFDHPYPPEHADLYEAIVEGGGAVLTEQLPSIEPRAELFPRRNRIIAGLSLVTVVVEAAERSGALLTARIAVEDLSRDVGCLPGSVDSAASAGCHRAIREGWATLVRGADDVCELIASARTLAVGAVERSQQPAPKPRNIPVVHNREPPKSNTNDTGHHRTEDARLLLDALRGLRSAGLDELERSVGWEIQRMAVALLELEMSGSVERDGDGSYRVRSRRSGGVA